jgi:hypothetical protein
MIALIEGRPRAALAALAREKRVPANRPGLERLEREARAQTAALEARRRELEQALAREPGRRDLADSLAAVKRRLAR